MLFSASMAASPVQACEASFGVCDGVLDDVAIRLEPVRLFDELAAFDLEDLHPAATLVLGRGDLQRWYQTTQRQAVNHLEAFFHVLAGRRLAACQLQGIL